ncbi:hypothetical protein DSO57_1002413 [Entomophthora muscae]|uniref:Uncharacterized protein n=1 Tax=Entomophthora muscae TaxID=34485 RepID=A0ACC2SAQ9_9FUNG|nr:hypothetical protein DSO57_1002413 [Entomophthora muscae]
MIDFSSYTFFCHNTNHILTYDSIQAKYPAPYYRNELPPYSQSNTHLWVSTLLQKIQELVDTFLLLILVSSAVVAPSSKASVIFETLRSKGLTSNLAFHVKCFAVKAALLALPSEVAVAMFCHSLDTASDDKEAWDPAPTSLEKAFVFACKLGGKLSFLLKSGILANLPVTKHFQVKSMVTKPHKIGAINFISFSGQVPNWPTTTEFLPMFSALAIILGVSSADPASFILTLQNKEDLLYFLFTATFYTRTYKANGTVFVNTCA